MRTVYIDVKKHKRLDSGRFATVYKISEKTVVKVFSRFRTYAEFLAEDEVEGSKEFNWALPAKKVRVILKDSKGRTRYTFGAAKRFLPFSIDFDEVPKNTNAYDAHQGNFMRDYDGTVYQVDTQTNSFINEFCKRHTVPYSWIKKVQRRKNGKAAV